MKKVVSILLILGLVLSLVACTAPATSTDPADSGEDTADQGDTTQEEVLEPITFTMGYTDSGTNADNNVMQVVLDYAEKNADKNVTLEWINLGPYTQRDEKLNIQFSANSQPNAIFGSALSETNVSKYSASGHLVKINDMITAENTPNIQYLFETVPSTKAVSTLPDGGIYSLPRYSPYVGDYLESPMYINQDWLDALDLEVPTTMDELFDVLLAFKTEDPNGNGEADEIPYLVNAMSSSQHFEVLLGAWGISTKDSTWDSFMTVKDGVVHFVPTMPEFKEALTYMNQMYEAGLFNENAFTITEEEFEAQRVSKNYGVLPGRRDEIDDSFTLMMPPTVEGYDTNWFYHPGAMGIKNQFVVTSTCEDPSRLLNYADGWWEPEQSLLNAYGPEGTIIVKGDDGVYNILEEAPADLGMSKTEWLSDNAVHPAAIAFAVYPENVGTLFNVDPISAYGNEVFYEYEDVITKEIWPRPFVEEEKMTRVSELRTDIFTTVSQMKAKWITGTSDIDAEWDTFQEDLERMGVEEFTQIYQEAYDSFVAGF